MVARNRWIVGGLCVVAAATMVFSLNSSSWLKGQLKGGDLHGGLVAYEACNTYVGCLVQPWGAAKNKARHHSLFSTVGLATRVLGGVSAALFVLFGILTLLGLQLDRVPSSQSLRFGVVDLKAKCLLVRFHPARGAARIGITACLCAGLFVLLRPQATHIGFAATLFVIAFAVCASLAHWRDKATFSIGVA